MLRADEGDYAHVSGLEMYYEIHGTGEPLILLHGGVGAIGMFGGVLSSSTRPCRRPGEP